MSERFGTAFDNLPLVKKSQNSELMKLFEYLKLSLKPGDEEVHSLGNIMATESNSEQSITRYVNFPMSIQHNTQFPITVMNYADYFAQLSTRSLGS